MTTVVLGISGSLRADSFNGRLLAAARAIAPVGVTLVAWDGLRDLPAYDEDLDVKPAPIAVRALREAIAASDAVFFVTPEYNGTIPGALKNAVDWASRPRGTAALLNKPVAVTGASTGRFGGVWAQADLRKALGVAGARVVKSEVALAKAAGGFDSVGDLVDHDIATGISEVLAQLAGQATAREGKVSELRGA